MKGLGLHKVASRRNGDTMTDVFEAKKEISV